VSIPATPEPEKRPSLGIEQAFDAYRRSIPAPETFAKLQQAIAASRPVGLEKLAESIRSLERAKLEHPRFAARLEEMKRPAPIPLPATRADIAALTDAVFELHDALVDQGVTQIELDRRQDRFDRRFRLLEIAISVTIGLATVVLALSYS
jgi:hypothetical protein